MSYFNTRSGHSFDDRTEAKVALLQDSHDNCSIDEMDSSQSRRRGWAISPLGAFSLVISVAYAVLLFSHLRATHSLDGPAPWVHGLEGK